MIWYTNLCVFICVRKHRCEHMLHVSIHLCVFFKDLLFNLTSGAWWLNQNLFDTFVSSALCLHLTLLANLIYFDIVALFVEASRHRWVQAPIRSWVISFLAYLLLLVISTIYIIYTWHQQVAMSIYKDVSPI